MDLHRLRVVEFGTSVREKELEKKHIAELEKCKNEERNTSIVRNEVGIEYENQCLKENRSPPVLSKKCLGEEISPRGAIKICVKDKRTPTRIFKQCSDDKLRLPETSKKLINDTTFTSHLGTSKIQRSKSEIFKIPPKKKPRQRALKINSSDLGLTKLFQDSAYSHQKKRTHLRNRSKNARIHHKEENVKEKSEEVHFLFAREKPRFIRYRRKRTDNERTKKKLDSKFPNDIYGFQTSNRSLDQYQYQISHFNFIDTDKLPLKKLRVGFHRKPKPPQPVTNCFCKHHAMRVLNSACRNSDSRPIYYNLGTHPLSRTYQQKHISDQEEGSKRERSHYMAKDEIVEVSPSSFSPVSKSYHDARTGPSKVELTSGSHHRPLCLQEKSTTLQNFTIASEYNQKSCPLPSAPSPYAACTVPSDRQDCELKKSQTFRDVTSVGNQKTCPLPSSPSPCTLCAARAAPAQNKCKKKRKKTRKPFLVLTLCNGFLSRLVKLVTDFHIKNNMSGKNCIKYVFFGLLIVVWSPCLLAVILAWVVIFPWKLTNILRTDVTVKRSFPINHSFKRFRKNNLRREYQQMCFKNYLPEKKSSFMTSAASWYSRTVGVVVNSFNAVISLLKLKKKTPIRVDSSCLPSSHPNPRKRYKLFYAENRGWVMKPLRRRTRSCASNRVWQSMRCEFRPKFWQKIRCQNLQQASLKKVPCPLHGTDNYPTHQSSPAGDACPVQSRNPWSSCTCWDKYLQRPPAFMPLKSHHHRKQQVNIPPTFYYTTSGIALISTDKTVHTKPNVFNSIKITNNITHKKFAKDHLEQRKNGTLPFGEVTKGLNKNDVGNILFKAPGAHRTTSMTDLTNQMPGCGLNRLRQTTKRAIPLNCLSARSHKLALANKNSTLQKKIYFSNKYALTDIFQSASTKQANTRTYKVNYAHQTQNTPRHISYQKVIKKQKTARAKAEMDSKCAREAKLLPPKQAYKYKTDNSRAPAQKNSSPAKIKSCTKHDILVNYSFGNKRKQSYKCKTNLVSVTTQILSKTADFTTMTNRDVALNGPCGKEHQKFKYGYEHKSHPISVAIQKQLCTADITTSTNRNVTLNCPLEEDYVLSKYSGKYKPSNPTHQPHQIPVATQMQSRTADNATSTKHNVALNFPCEEKHKLSKQGYKHKQIKVPVATQMQLKTADISTSTNRNVATNYPCEEKHKLSNQSHKSTPHQILVGTQMQSRTVENATDMKGDLSLIRPCEAKHELSQHSNKHKLHKLTVATQMQQRTADNATETNRDVALNYPSCVKLGTANKEKPCIASTTDKETKYNEEMNLFESVYKYIPGQIPVATQKQSNTADITTMTNYCEKTLNYPHGEKHEKFEQAYKCKSDNIPVGTQKHPSTANMITSTKYLDGVTQSTPNNRIPHACIPTTSKKDTICTQKTNPPEYLTKTQDISIQKNSYKIDASANCVSNYERSKTKDIFHLELTMSPKKTVDCTDATTSWRKTAHETKLHSLNSKSGPLFGMALDCRCGEAPPKNEPDKELNQMKAGSGKEPPSKQPNLIQSPSRTLQEQSTFGIASDCKCGTSQITAVEKNLYNNVTGFKSIRAKKTKSKYPSVLKKSSTSEFPKSPEHSPLRKSLPRKCRWKSFPCKCRYKSLPRQCRCPIGSLQDSVDQQPYGSNDSSTSTERNIFKVYIPRSKSFTRKFRFPVESLQDSVGKLTYGTKISKLTSKRSAVKEDKIPKSSDHTPSHEYLQQTCPCPVRGLQDSVRKQSAGTKVNKTFSKINSVKVDKTHPKLSKSSEHTPPQKYFHHDCTYPVKNLQDPVGKKTSQSSRKSVFSYKSKHNSLDFPDECPCSFSQCDLNKISFKSDVPVNWNTTKRFFIRSRESNCSDNEPSSRVQSSRISQYSSKVSSLVMSLRSKLFSRKSKQTKIAENPIKKPLPVTFSSLQVEPKKTKQRASSIDDILKSLLDDKSNQGLIRRSHKSKTSQNPSVPLHSRCSSCSCVIHKSSTRQSSRKNQYIRKPLVVDKSYSCSVAKTFQRPSFISHSTKYDCRSQSIIVDPRVSQSIISQQSKTPEHSSIVTLFMNKSLSKSQSAQIQSSKKFDPQYSSTLINCQQTPTVRQSVRSQLPPSPKTLKSGKSSLFNRTQSKLFFEKIRSITDKMSTNTLKDKQDKKVSIPGGQTTLIYPSNLSKKVSHISVERTTIRQPKVTEQSLQFRSTQPNIPNMDSFHRSYPPELLTVKKQFDVIRQQLNAEQVIPISTGSYRCAEEQKVTKKHSSNKKHSEAIPQPPKTEQVIPIISGRCACAGEQNNIIENSSNKKLQLNTISPPLGNEKKAQFLQYLSNQALKSPASKLSQRHSSHPTGTPHNTPLRHFQSANKKPCKCRSFKLGNEQEINNLNKIVKNRRLPEKFHKSHLISHVCTCSGTARRLKEHKVHRSDISQSLGIRPRPQIQIYEQNLPDQKRLSKIPTNVDNPPPEMLQQHSPRHGRKSTAEGEIQQRYPDFDRVLMRYPNHKSPPKQSLQIPGINGPPPANNYPPAPGATPPTNYACDPCYTYPPKRCLPKSPYDESALRRAYKRRPLRYTPPKQQLPRVVMVKKLKENKQRAAETKRRRGIQRTENFFKCLRHLINKTEREVWPADVKCHPMWLNALKRKPCFCIYKAFPRAYPTFLNCYKTHKYIGQLLIYFITLCFWSPLLLCGYLCCNVLCKCCS